VSGLDYTITTSRAVTARYKNEYLENVFGAFTSIISSHPTGADLGFYKGGCPIHQKRALEVECRRGWVCALPIKFFVFLISKWWVLMDSEAPCWAKNDMFWTYIFFSKKGTLIKRAGVQTPPIHPPPSKLNGVCQNSYTERTLCSSDEMRCEWCGCAPLSILYSLH